MITEDNLILATAQIVSAIISSKQYELFKLDNVPLSQLIYTVKEEVKKGMS